jgi:hypothetical protein
VWSETLGEDGGEIVVAGRGVTDGERPPLMRPIGKVGPASPGGVHSQHWQRGAGDQSDEVAGVIVDLNFGAPIRLHPLTEPPS